MKIVIAIVVVVGLGAVAGAIWVGNRSFERTVVADPYESGIHHDADRKKAQALGWNVVVDEGALRAGPEARLEVVLTGKDGAAIDDADVTLRVTRPGTSRFDRSARATHGSGGRYGAVLAMPEAGFWDLDVVIRRGEESLTLGKWIHAAGEVGEGVHCDAGLRACAADAGGVRVVLELSPRPPVPLKGLDAAVQLSRGGQPLPGAEVAVEISMPGMFMGDNRIPLRESGAGRYAGTGALLRCTSGRRDWQAEVVVRTPGAPEARARFPFQAAE